LNVALKFYRKAYNILYLNAQLINRDKAKEKRRPFADAK